ncbi:hypothetical protein D3C78_1580230 [compost metagenome]
MAQLNFILHPFGKIAFTPLARIQRGFKCFGSDAFFFDVQCGFGKLLAEPQWGQRQVALIAAVTYCLYHQRVPGIGCQRWQLLLFDEAIDVATPLHHVIDFGELQIFLVFTVD